LGLESVGGRGMNEVCADGEGRRTRGKAGRVCGEVLGGWRLKTGAIAGLSKGDVGGDGIQRGGGGGC
jgi:hypothetical protein